MLTNPPPHVDTDSGTNRHTTIFNSIVAEYNDLKTTTNLSANFKPSFGKRTLKIPVPRPETQINRIVNLTDQLQRLFQLLISGQNQHQQYAPRSKPGASLTERDNDLIIEVIVYIGSLITKSSRPELLNAVSYRVDDQFKLYLRYAQMITNLAEKTVSCSRIRVTYLETKY